MSRKHCPFSFSCEAITQTPGLLAAQCPNLAACSDLAKSAVEGETVNLQVGTAQRSIAMSASSAATLMLRQRGNPQDLESLGIVPLMETLQETMTKLEAQLAPESKQYIAPEGTEVHAYAVKRPYGTYWYNKLAAHKEMFHPQVQQSLVRHIHLGKTGEPRHREAQAGIEHRNQLVKTRTQLMIAAKALQAALAALQTPIS